MEGKVCGWLTVIKEASNPNSLSREAHWECKCRCGSICIISGNSLRSKNTVSCGCKKHTYNHMVKHNMYETRFYACWSDMKYRCHPKNRNRHRYYDRGIKVCKRWQKFENFKEDMFSSYKDNLTLDRINNNQGYFKKNCRWTTMKEQSKNREGTKLFTFKGKKQTLDEIAKITNIKPNTLRSRLANGMTLKTALLYPYYYHPTLHMQQRASNGCFIKSNAKT